MLHMTCMCHVCDVHVSTPGSCVQGVALNAALVCWLQVSLLVCPWLPMGGTWDCQVHKHLVAPFKQQVNRPGEQCGVVVSCLWLVGFWSATSPVSPTQPGCDQPRWCHHNSCWLCCSSSQQLPRLVAPHVVCRSARSCCACSSCRPAGRSSHLNAPA